MRRDLTARRRHSSLQVRGEQVERNKWYEKQVGRGGLGGVVHRAMPSPRWAEED